MEWDILLKFPPVPCWVWCPALSVGGGGGNGMGFARVPFPFCTFTPPPHTHINGMAYGGRFALTLFICKCLLVTKNTKVSMGCLLGSACGKHHTSETADEPTASPMFRPKVSHCCHLLCLHAWKSAQEHCVLSLSPELPTWQEILVFDSDSLLRLKRHISCPFSREMVFRRPPYEHTQSPEVVFENSIHLEPKWPAVINCNRMHWVFRSWKLPCEIKWKEDGLLGYFLARWFSMKPSK